MDLLLDTQILLWVSIVPRALPSEAETLVNDAGNSLFFSAASVWEIAIKSSVKRPDFDVDPHVLRRTLLDNGYTELPVTGQHAIGVATLPPFHKDPFDRLLVAQAIVEGMLLVTADGKLARYPGPIRLVRRGG
jgi:PIN domain nuclease of toxin-antitoxin system